MSECTLSHVTAHNFLAISISLYSWENVKQNSICLVNLFFIHFRIISKSMSTESSRINPNQIPSVKYKLSNDLNDWVSFW